MVYSVLLASLDSLVGYPNKRRHGLPRVPAFPDSCVKHPYVCY